MKILQTNLQNKAILAPSAVTSNNVIGINMSNILAFAHVPPGEEDQFNEDTDNLWPEAAKLKPAQAKALFKLRLSELSKDDASFNMCVHPQLLDTLVNVAFEPGDTCSTKPHLGISPVAFAPRKLEEIKGLQHQTDLNERASFVTTQDTDKTKLGAPLLPTTLTETIDTIKRCATFVEFILGQDCKFGRYNRQVVQVLHRNYERFYKCGSNFGQLFGYELLFQLHNIAIEFFGTSTSRKDWENGVLPDFDGTWLLVAISSMQLRNSAVRPEMFGPKPATQVTPTGPNKQTTQKQSNNNKPSQKLAGKQKQERRLPAEFSKALEDFTQRTNKRMTVANVRKGLNLADATELANHLGLDPNKDCQRIHLLGACPGCTRNHSVNPNFKKEEALDALKKATLA